MAAPTMPPTAAVALDCPLSRQDIAILRAVAAGTVEIDRASGASGASLLINGCRCSHQQSAYELLRDGLVASSSPGVRASAVLTATGRALLANNGTGGPDMTTTSCYAAIDGVSTPNTDQHDTSTCARCVTVFEAALDSLIGPPPDDDREPDDPDDLDEWSARWGHYWQSARQAGPTARRMLARGWRP